jgi:hypothetical protein
VSSSSSGGGAGSCCTANQGPGCSDPVAQQCVCGFDSYCCSTQWDAQCVSEAQSDCGFCGGSSSSSSSSASSTSASSGGGCPSPGGWGGLGCDPQFSAGCATIGCSCCEDGQGIGHCC